MACGLGLWGMSIGGAQAPRVLRAMLYPNDAGDAHFDLVSVAVQPLGAPVVWTALVLWCVSWTFVAGYIVSACAAHEGRPSWATPALLLLSLASPILFGFTASVLLRLASRDAYRASGVITFLPAVLAQLAISVSYSFMTGSLPRVRAWWRSVHAGALILVSHGKPRLGGPTLG